MLQEQYFNDLQIPYVQGKSNYVCRKNSKLTCDMGACSLFKNKKQNDYKCNDCPYYTARNIAYKSNISNLNYSYFLSMCGNDIQSIRDLIVLDECHNIEDELINSKSLKISKKDLSYHEVLLSLPKENIDTVNKFSWLVTTCLDTLIDYFNRLTDQIDSYNNTSKNKYYYKIVKDCSFVEELINKINQIKDISIDNIIIQQNKTDDIYFKLLYGLDLFSQYIKPYGRKILAMSATIFDKDLFCKNLGIDRDNVVFINCPSVFPKENRPIHINSVGKMTYKEKETTYPKLLNKVKEILNTHLKDKGIIHTVNYEIADYLYDNLHDSRLILPKGKDRAEKIDQFLNSSVDEPYVLISPSLTEGIDLKEDLSRFCIICKVPYLNIKDSWVERRMKDNYDWYVNSVVETMVQMTGRSIRSETDYAESYILDQSFEQFMYFNGNKFPKWWIKSIIK